jgi:hypothetical protein
MYKILKGQSEAVDPRKADNKIDKCTLSDFLGFMLLITPLASCTFVYCIVCLSRIYASDVNPRKADNAIDKCTRY